jgi:hypothetical protein
MAEFGDWTEVRLALDGKQGADQQRIAAEGVAWLALLLRKNHDYGSSAWRPPVLKPALDAGDAILVRMSDKVERIASLTGKGPAVGESLEDTIRDLGAYCLLWLSRPREPSEVCRDY